MSPPGIWMPVPNHSGPMSAHLGTIMHSQEGDGSVYGEFSNPASQASYHRWISKSGRIEWYIDLALESWAQKAGNGTYISMGFEGFVAQPLTEAQLDSGALCILYDFETFGIPFQLAEAPGQQGFGWHGMGCNFDWGHCVCPGPIRRGQRQEILNRALALKGGTDLTSEESQMLKELHDQMVVNRVNQDGSGIGWAVNDLIERMKAIEAKLGV